MASQRGNRLQTRYSCPTTIATYFLILVATMMFVAEWTFLTNHANALVCIAHDPEARLRDIAATLGISERRASDIVTDLAEAGYLEKVKDGRRNRYRIQAQLPLRRAVGKEPTIGEVLGLLVEIRAPLSKSKRKRSPRH